MTFLTAAPSLVHIDDTFLPVGRMRQVSRVTAINQGTIHGEVDLGQSHCGPG